MFKSAEQSLIGKSQIETSTIELAPMLFIVMGVSGTGKSSLAKKMSTEFSMTFLDADDFHSDEAKKHMANDKPLTDEMRVPWLETIVAHLNSLHQQGKSVALAYSGLKSAHRQLFRELPFYCHFFYLDGHKDIISKRMSQRENHFFSAELLNSQFEAMETPLSSEQDVSIINIDRSYLSVSNEINNLAQLITKQVITTESNSYKVMDKKSLAIKQKPGM